MTGHRTHCISSRLTGEFHMADQCESARRLTQFAQMHTESSTVAITSIIDQLNLHQLTKACSQTLLANSSRLCEPTGSSRCTLTQSGHCHAPEHACALTAAVGRGADGDGGAHGEGPCAGC